MRDTQTDLFYGTSGPRSAKIVIVGEAWGRDEAYLKRPFVGASGKLLDQMLSAAGLSRASVLCTNVVAQQPEGNDLARLCIPNKATKGLEPTHGLYLDHDLAAGRERLLQLLNKLQPDLIIVCGNWPLWALCPSATKISTQKGVKLPSGIIKYRGSQLYSETLERATPVLPIIHPAATLRDFSHYFTTVHDLRTRAPLAQLGLWDEPSSYQFQPKPTYEQTMNYLNRLLAVPHHLVLDIETIAQKYISCIGFSCHKEEAICIPFFYYEGGSLVAYWTPKEEEEIIFKIREVLEHPKIRVIGQNLLYDWQYLERLWNIKPRIYWDTMIAQHLLYPGTPKSLDYLSSLYCNHHVYWKDETQEWKTSELDAERLWTYNCKDTRATFEIAMEQMGIIKAKNLDELMSDQIDQSLMALEMMARGCNVDIKERNSQAAQLRIELSKLEHLLLEMMPEHLRGPKPWFESPVQTMTFFYEWLGLPPQIHRKTLRPTADDTALNRLKLQVPWLNLLFETLADYRSTKVFLSHFYEPPLSLGNRVRCSFNTAGTETFRWSSSATGFGEGTNMQNIPKGTED